MECSKRSSKREVHSDECLHQETSTISNNFTPQGTRKQTKPQVSRRREITNSRAEINEIETKTTVENTNEAKSWFSEKIKIEKPFTRLTKKKRGFK